MVCIMNLQTVSLKMCMRYEISTFLWLLHLYRANVDNIHSVRWRKVCKKETVVRSRSNIFLSEELPITICPNTEPMKGGIGYSDQSFNLPLCRVKRYKIALTNDGEQHVVEKQRHEHDK